MLQDLKKKVLAGQIPLHEALGKGLPVFRGRVSDERLTWLVNEMQGYPNALEFYQRPTQDFPPYRVVNGEMKLVDQSGNMTSVKHPLATRAQFFVSAPVSWLEEAKQMGGSTAVIEMQELSSYFKNFGGIVVLTTQDEVTRILNSFRQSFTSLIDEVLAKGAA